MLLNFSQSIKPTVNIMKVNPMEERFAQIYMLCMDAHEAFKQVWQDVKAAKPDTQNKSKQFFTKRGNEMLSRPQVQKRIEEIQQEEAEIAMWQRKDSIETLAGIACDFGAPANGRVASVKELNSMLGYDKPRRVEVDMSSTDGTMTPVQSTPIDTSKMSTEAIKEVLDAMKANEEVDDDDMDEDEDDSQEISFL